MDVAGAMKHGRGTVERLGVGGRPRDGRGALSRRCGARGCSRSSVRRPIELHAPAPARSAESELKRFGLWRLRSARFRTRGAAECRWFIFLFREGRERHTTHKLYHYAWMEGSGGRVIKKYTIKLKISGRSRCKSKRDSHLGPVLRSTPLIVARCRSTFRSKNKLNNR